MSTVPEAQIVRDLAVASVEPRTPSLLGVNETPFVIVPAGATLQSLEHLLPPRRKARASFDEVGSFIDYVNTYKSEGTRVFAQLSSGTFNASLDYLLAAPSTEGSRFDHGASLSLTLTEEAKRWLGLNGKVIPQLAFAEFLEDNHHFVTVPDGARMLEIALTLEATQGYQFKSAQRLQNGDQEIKWVEKTEGKAGKDGDLEIPAAFTVVFPLYEGGEFIELVAKLRYRVKDAAVVFQVTYPDYEKKQRAYVAQIVEKIEKETGLRLWSGRVA